jgi:nitrogen-specific signal transduction histidine kinase
MAAIGRRDGEKSHQLAAHYGTDIPPIRIDRSSLLRAFLNVMRNAVQFMPQAERCL